MADREIKCCRCNKHVGIIRDAKLMVGLKFICPSCDDEYEKGSLFDDYDGKFSSKDDSFMNIFNDIFKKGYKK